MKRLFKLVILCQLLCLNCQWSVAQTPWRQHLKSDEGVILHIDLHEETITVPGMEDFGPSNGYLGGDIYGVWMVTSFKIQDDRNATLRLSNDLGSEIQNVVLRQENDSTWSMQLKGYNAIRRVKDKKLVKMPSSYTMHSLSK